MYDFMVFGYYASSIAKAFFPGHGPFVSLMLSLMTFGAGFLMRPVGAVVLGAFTDRHGRRAGLLVTLSLMAVGTVSLAATPGYAVIGWVAPILVVAGRLLQGFSAGMELGGVSVYLSEIAPPGRKGFYVSWQSASQQVAVIFAAAIGLILNVRLGPAVMDAWGWRIPLLLGCLIAPVIFLLRRSLHETTAFAARTDRLQPAQVAGALATHWRIVALGAMLAVTTTVAFYLITAYTPTFGGTILRLSSLDAFVVTFCVGLSNLIWLPVMGSLSDRVGRRPLLIACTVLMIFTAYPAMVWLKAGPSFVRLLSVELWLSFLYASYNSAMVVTLTEIIPERLRTLGFSLAYSLATAIFGGFTPAICTALIHWTGDKAVPGLWLAVAAAIGLAASLLTARGRGRREPV
jgi:MFS family permease